MPAKQRMRLANVKHSQNVSTRGNVPKTLVSVEFFHNHWRCIYEIENGVASVLTTQYDLLNLS
jgi:hypothetical protein